MISLELARQLRVAGLRWQPAEGDRFVVPDRGMEDQVFTISGMTVDVRDVPGGQIIAFNGTVEWALDSINQWEVVWLPRESQLRQQLGEAFVSLTREHDTYHCEVQVDGRRSVESHPDAAEAYGQALLQLVAQRTRDELASLKDHRSSVGHRDLAS